MLKNQGGWNPVLHFPICDIQDKLGWLLVYSNLETFPYYRQGKSAAWRLQVWGASERGDIRSPRCGEFSRERALQNLLTSSFLPTQGTEEKKKAKAECAKYALRSLGQPWLAQPWLGSSTANNNVQSKRVGELDYPACFLKWIKRKCSVVDIPYKKWKSTDCNCNI